MGGNLAWTLRCEDGTEYRMDRWTNSMPALILNPGFLAGEDVAIEAALGSWIAMQEDWEENREIGTFRHTMTASYAPYPYGLKPSEYGLVVTDFVTKTILSLQNYTDLGRIYAMRQCHGPDSSEIAPGKAEQIATHAREGSVKHYEFILRNDAAARAFETLGAHIEAHPNDKTVRIVTVPGTVDLAALNAVCDALRNDVPEHPQASVIAAMRNQMEAGNVAEGKRAKMAAALEALTRSHRHSHNPFISGYAVIDLAPFTLEDFPNTAEGFTAMRARVLALGFTLDASEEEGWAERIAYCLEEA